MSQWPIYRNVWALGPTKSGYPGGFPSGLIPKIRKRWWGTKRLWLFSGSYHDTDQITVDIKLQLNPSIVANCEDLPIKDEIFDFVLLDPPYSEKESNDMYNVSYHNIIKVMNEAARVSKTGGYVLLLHRLVPFYHPDENIHKRRLQVIAVVGIYLIAGYSNIRALTVFRKSETLDDWITSDNNSYAKQKSKEKEVID